MRAVTQHGPAVAQRVAVVGEALTSQIDALTDDVQKVIVDLIPDLRADAIDVLHDSIRENLETALRAFGTRAGLERGERACRQRSNTPEHSRRPTYPPPR